MLAYVQICPLLVCSAQLCLTLVHMILILEVPVTLGHADSCVTGKEKMESNLLALKTSAQMLCISQGLMHNWPKQLIWYLSAGGSTHALLPGN